MIKRFSIIVFALSAIVAVTACAETADLQAQSLAQWKAYCAAKGKQFLWKDMVADRDWTLINERVQLEGKCVGPGERGYRAPEPPDDEP